MKTLCFVSFIILFLISCGDEKYYFICINDEECYRVDGDPRNDEGAVVLDNENFSDSDSIGETEDFDEILDEIPEIDDEKKDDVVPDNDTDIPEDVCIYLKNTGILGKCFEAQDGEKIFISDKNEPGRCKATVESTVFPNRFFYGIELPFYTGDNSSSLDYNGATQKVIIDTKEFGKSSC